MALKVKEKPNDRWWDGWLASFALLLILIVAGRLEATQWTPNLNILVFLSIFAGIAGLAIGYSRFSPLLSVLFSIIYGLFSFGWLFGLTLDSDIAWRDRILNVLGFRLRFAIEQFNMGESFVDPILFLTIMAIMLWILAFSVGFLLVREGAIWPSIIPLGFTLMVISHYDMDIVQNARFLLLFLLFFLLLLGRMTMLEYRKKWQLEGIRTNSRIHADLTRTIVIITLVVLLLAWVIPITYAQATRYSDFWDGIVSRWDRVRENYSNIFSFESARRVILSSGYFSESMGLGSSTPSSQEVVFIADLEPEKPQGYRNYWRARIYDIYDQTGWTSSAIVDEKLLFPDNFSIQHPDWEGGLRLTVTITNGDNPLRNLYTTGSPISVSRPVQAITYPLPELQEDLIALIADPDLLAGETYQIETLVNRPTARQLAESSKEYPDWLDRYLQLPGDFSPEIRALAAEISEGLESPLAITQQITQYLRSNITYADTIPPIPVGADPMEWFLFEGKEGFCNYYATAQVLMLRSLGVPARLAVGYAEGEFDPLNGTYIVREIHSHAWPEVYFSGFGWVEFEPTVSEAPLFLPGVNRPQDELNQLDDLPRLDQLPEEFDPQMGGESVDQPAADPQEQEPQSLPPNSTSQIAMMITFSVALLLLIVIFLRLPAWAKIKMKPLPVLMESALIKWDKPVPNWLRRWRYAALMSAAEKAYLQIGRSIKILGYSLNLAETPSERALTLTGLLPEAEPFAQIIITEYQLDKFSVHPSDGSQARTAARQVLGLAVKARLSRIFNFRKRK